MIGIPLLSARLDVHYGAAQVLHQVQFDLQHGEILGLVGLSGSGKSTLALALLRLLDWRGGRVSGSIQYGGRDILKLSEAEFRALRGREIALVLQSAAAAFNPVLRLDTQFAEAWRAHSRIPWPEQRPVLLRRLARFGLPAEAEFLRRYPGEVSVGQAQRLLVAMALLHEPPVLIADEITSALDLLTQREVLATLREANSAGASVIFISHDLLAVAGLCHRVAILEAGRIVECAPTVRIFSNPQHSYTRRLVESLPAAPQFSGFDAAACSLAPLAATIEESNRRRGVAQPG